MPKRRAWTIAVMAAAALALLFVLWWAVPDDPTPPARTEAAVAAVTKPAVTPRRATATTPTFGRPRVEWAPRPPDAETVDPCTAIRDPELPEGFDSVSVDGITVAYARVSATPNPYDRPLQPSVLARATLALLEEAAEATGTPARSQLTVIVWPDKELFRSRTKAPIWAGGLYDGGVEIPADAHADLGVSLATLRHEIMHAQLHYSVGCTPVWFDEGVAQLFGGEVPVRTWNDAMRAHGWFDTRDLAVSSVVAVHTDEVRRVYAESLAMVVVALDKVSLSDLVLAVRGADLDVWERRFGLDAHAVLDALARRIYGISLGGDLDALLATPVCCSQVVDPRAIRCHASPPHEERYVWLDQRSAPTAACSTRW